MISTKDINRDVTFEYISAPAGKSWIYSGRLHIRIIALFFFYIFYTILCIHYITLLFKCCLDSLNSLVSTFCFKQHLHTYIPSITFSVPLNYLEIWTTISSILLFWHWSMAVKGWKEDNAFVSLINLHFVPLGFRHPLQGIDERNCRVQKGLVLCQMAKAKVQSKGL